MVDINVLKAGDIVLDTRFRRLWRFVGVYDGRVCVRDGVSALNEFFDADELELVESAPPAAPAAGATEAIRLSALSGWANSSLRLAALGRGLGKLNATLRHSYANVWALWSAAWPSPVELELDTPESPDGKGCVLQLVQGTWVARVLGGQDDAFQQAARRLRDAFCSTLHAAVEKEEVTKNNLVRLLTEAERFISGFEDDEAQEGIPDLLKRIRAAIGVTDGAATTECLGRMPAVDAAAVLTGWANTTPSLVCLARARRKLGATLYHIAEEAWHISGNTGYLQIEIDAPPAENAGCELRLLDGRWTVRLERRAQGVKPEEKKDEHG